MTQLSRRNALLGSVAIAATAASGSVTAAGAAQPIEPLIELDRLWQARLQVANAIPDDMSWEDWQPHFDAVADLEVEIRETSAKSFAGLAVKLRLYAHHAGLFDRSESWGFDWQDELMKAAIRDVERLAGEALS
jgi:hypothetical protein